MTFLEMAELVGAVRGMREVEIRRVARAAEATDDAVVFATDAKTLEEALASAAGAILVSRNLVTKDLVPRKVASDKSLQADASGSVDRRVLEVGDARYAFALVGSHLRSATAAEVHASAVLGRDVRFGVGTSVGPHAVIEDGVRAGDGCLIGANVTIHSGTVLGDRVVVQAGAVLGSTGFGYARDPETGRYLLFPQQGNLLIGDDVEIGANTTIDRGALGETRIGRGTKIDNLVHVGHNCVIGDDVIIAAQTGISGSSVVEDGAILGGQVGIGEHATVGRGVILGGGAGVLSGKKMHGSGTVFWGRPARPLQEYLRSLARGREEGRGKRAEPTADATAATDARS